MNIKVYSADWCPYCHALMDWLDSLGVKYEEIDVDSLPDNAAKGISSLPVTEIGEQKIIGFDRPALQKALKKIGVL